MSTTSAPSSADEEKKRKKREESQRWRDANPDYFRNYYRKNKSKINAQNSKWAKVNKERKNAASRALNARKPDVQKNTHLKHRYGITLEERAALFQDPEFRMRHLWLRPPERKVRLERRSLPHH